MGDIPQIFALRRESGTHKLSREIVYSSLGEVPWVMRAIGSVKRDCFVWQVSLQRWMFVPWRFRDILRKTAMNALCMFLQVEYCFIDSRQTQRNLLLKGQLIHDRPNQNIARRKNIFYNKNAWPSTSVAIQSQLKISWYNYDNFCI